MTDLPTKYRHSTFGRLAPGQTGFTLVQALTSTLLKESTGDAVEHSIFS